MSAFLASEKSHHWQPAGFAPPKGTSVLAYAPHCPVPREERWYVILADAANNAVLTWSIASLLEAEKAGLELARRKAQGEDKAVTVADLADAPLANGVAKNKGKKGEQSSGMPLAAKAHSSVMRTRRSHDAPADVQQTIPHRLHSSARIDLLQSERQPTVPLPLSGSSLASPCQSLLQNASGLETRIQSG